MLLLVLDHSSAPDRFLEGKPRRVWRHSDFSIHC